MLVAVAVDQEMEQVAVQEEQGVVAQEEILHPKMALQEQPIQAEEVAELLQLVQRQVQVVLEVLA